MNHKELAKKWAERFGMAEDWKLLEADLESLVDDVLSGREPYYRAEALRIQGKSVSLFLCPMDLVFTHFDRTTNEASVKVERGAGCSCPKEPKA